MYSLFCRNIRNYHKYVPEQSYRYEIAQPLLLLSNKGLYEREKETDSIIYYNLLEILESAENVKQLNRYRKFHVFLRELYDKGFMLAKSNSEYRFSKEILLDQIELLRQCMYFTYC